MSYLAKFVAALVGCLLIAIVASRQFFLFAVSSPAGGRSHFWLAAAAATGVIAAGGLMFYFFSRHEKNKWSKVVMTPTGPLFNLNILNPLNSPARATFDVGRWALANPWLSEGHADDRTPMDGSVTDSGENPSGQRAFARRTHQLMFKKWSQARHD